MSGAHDDDDPQLKSLRQVWLSMRDEDPPERGLDALMAAARSHAQILAKPTLWQRFVTSMRRPPMLALATVMVLLGGVLILTRHGDELEKAPSSPPPQMDTAAPTVRDPESAVHTKVQTVDKPVIEKALQTTKPPEPIVHPHAHPTPRPQRPSNEDGFVGGARGEEAPPPQPQPQPQGAAGKADATVAKEPKQPNEVLVDQLAAQARSAMTRGDCETAKVIGARIARQDPTYYRDNVASTLAKCSATEAAH